MSEAESEEAALAWQDGNSDHHQRQRYPSHRRRDLPSLSHSSD